MVQLFPELLSVRLPRVNIVANIQHINDERSSAALAALLNGNTRRKPVVLITSPAGRTEPWIDVEDISQEAGALAEVYLMPTGSFTWEFSNRMADGTQVYGGAGRVYPVGHEWASDLTKSPLRFAFNEDDGRRATQQLISDMFRMASAAGLLQSVVTHELRKVAGPVKLVIAGRALVDVGNLLPAGIAEELTVDDVAIDRIVTPGQQIEGWYDRESNRVDVRKSLRPSTDALAKYSVGDVVLTKVVRVRNGKAELLLYPKTSSPPVIVAVLRADVDLNPTDDLRTLMTIGEVIPARVVSIGPQWALVLNDVDDDEPIVEAPSLLAGGPPWLTEEPEHPEVDEPHGVLPSPLPMPSTAPAPEHRDSRSKRFRWPRRQSGRTRHCSTDPAHVRLRHPDRRSCACGRRRSWRINPGPVAQGRRPAAEVGGLKREVDSLQTERRASADEREQLRFLLEQAERRANKAENDLKSTRARLRKAGGSPPRGAVGEGPQFADLKEGFRYLVLTQWASRTLPSEQSDRPLVDYDIGPRFLESLERLEGIKVEKVADVVFEIVTGLARQLPSREVHRLRTGSGGDDPVRIRDDGAVAWRASLQVNTPSARRIHYWVLPSGRVDLARVSTHDDFTI